MVTVYSRWYAGRLGEKLRRPFVRFLQLAARESGQILNYAAISHETGISQPTVKNYYQLLEDMFVGFRVPAYSRSPRKNLLSTPKFFLFDLGVRHTAAGLKPSADLVHANPGPLFEQWVGIELWKRLQYLGEGTLFYQRTRDGAEVDFIVEHGGRLTPIEVKWTERPSLSDARHLLTFLGEHPRNARRGTSSAAAPARCNWMTGSRRCSGTAYGGRPLLPTREFCYGVPRVSIAAR